SAAGNSLSPRSSLLRKRPPGRRGGPIPAASSPLSAPPGRGRPSPPRAGSGTDGAPPLLDVGRLRLERLLGPGGGDRGAGRDQVLPLELGGPTGITKGGGVRLP